MLFFYNGLGNVERWILHL